MSNVAETSETQQIFKQVYADGVDNLVPNTNVLQKLFKFENTQKIGKSYHFAVQVRWPQGSTWNGGTNYGLIKTLADSRAGLSLQAETKGCEYILRDMIAYGSASKSADGQAAFTPITDLTVAAVVESTAWNLELMLMNGGGSIGAVASKTNSSATESAVIVTVASWAPGNWASYEGAQMDCYDSTLTTKQNTNGPITIDSIDIDTRTINVTFAANADQTACTAGDVFVPLGAFGNWVGGMLPTLTTSVAGGSLYGITTGDYALLQAGTYDASGAALTFAKLANAAITSVTKGGMGDLTALVSHYAWTDINNDEAGSRRYTDDYGGEFVNGADRLTYYGPNGGKLEVMPHPMMPAGNAVLINPTDWRRIGSSEPTFELPGRGSMGNPMFLTERQDENAWEFRRWWDQASICKRLGRQVLITNITNSSGPA